jgi:hypothetical protein
VSSTWAATTSSWAEAASTPTFTGFRRVDTRTQLNVRALVSVASPAAKRSWVRGG